KNPLTFASYAELRDTFRDLAGADDVDAVVITGSERNFCSGGDVRDIIGPLTEMDMGGLLRFTRMTGDLVKAIRGCRQPVIGAVQGVWRGGGAGDAPAGGPRGGPRVGVAAPRAWRLGTAEARAAFLFTRVGLAGCDMGACALLPRIIGQGRAAELLFTGRPASREEAHAWGFYNRLCDPDELVGHAQTLARELASGPTFAHGITKKMLHQEWNMGIDEAIESEAQAQAICMATQDFGRAYRA